MKKFAIISDIHGNILALEQVAVDIKRRQVDKVINLGDHVSGPLWPKETIRYLMQQDWVQIAGNHDRQVLDHHPDDQGPSDSYASQLLDEAEKQWLRTLPATAKLDGGLFLFHGSPTDDTTYLLETIDHGRTRLATPEEIKHRLGPARSGVMLCGHTHTSRVVELPDGSLIVNPGSVGLPAYHDDHPEPHVVEAGSPHARYAIMESRNGKWIVESILVSYDCTKASEQALKNHRPDWGAGLRTGYMPPQV